MAAPVLRFIGVEFVEQWLREKAATACCTAGMRVELPSHDYALDVFGLDSASCKVA